MSLHRDCEKCGKYLGGIWPCETESAEWNKTHIFDPFFKGSAKSACDNWETCEYNER